jgi:hypothetical protein
VECSIISLVSQNNFIEIVLMKKTILFSLPFLLFTILASGQSKTSQTVNTGNFKTLDDKIFSIQYPDNWDLDQKGQLGTSFVLFSKPSSPQDKFRENVNLLVQDLTGHNITLDKYVETSKGQIKSMINKVNILESKKLNANGTDFEQIVFTGSQGKYDLKFEQYYWVKNQKAYVLTFTCEISEFNNFKVAGEKILNSFRIK